MLPVLIKPMNYDHNAPEITKQPSYLSTGSTGVKTTEQDESKDIHAKVASCVERKPQ